MPRGLCDSQVDCGVLQVWGFAFWDVEGGGPDVGLPDQFLRGCTRSSWASRYLVLSWRMADACSVVVGSPAFTGSRWRVAVVRRLSSAKLMRGDRSGYGTYPHGIPGIPVRAPMPGGG